MPRWSQDGGPKWPQPVHLIDRAERAPIPHRGPILIPCVPISSLSIFFVVLCLAMSKCFCRADLGYTCQPCTFGPPKPQVDAKNVIPGGLTLAQLNKLVESTDLFATRAK